MTGYKRVNARILTAPAVLLVLVMAAGGAAVAFRMMHGLGASTNLSDHWPWGLWKGFNVLCLIALGAGGFTSAALIYVFGREEYHQFARPAALWGLLCYCFAAASLMVDIGIPWRIVNPIYMWPKHSILFEVAWCVMLYILVLSLEVAPSVFERFGLGGLETAWRRLTPAFAVGALAFFTYIMSHSIVWASASLILFALLSIFVFRKGDRTGVPFVLVMFGVILSTLHQSSLGSLFLLVPEKLSHFWWSPLLPVNFFISAIMCGFAVLIIERTVTQKAFGLPLPDEQLAGLAKVVAVFAWACLALRLGEVMAELGRASEFGGAAIAFGGWNKGTLFIFEIVPGLIAPAIILSFKSARRRRGPRAVGAALAVMGVLFNRLNVTFLGMSMPGAYHPSALELLFSVAVISAIVFLFSIGAKLMPIYQGGGDSLAQARVQFPPV